MNIHVINRGDTIYRLSQKYGVSIDTIIDANQITAPESLVVGQAIVIPGDFTQHIVRSGETMYSIAQYYRIPLSRLINANPQIANPSKIQIGQTVIVPVSSPKKRSIYVNGYIYPWANTDVLKNVFPHLSYVSVFSYMVKQDGSLNTINDSQAVQSARKAGVAPVMVITNTEEGAGFSSELAHAILSDIQIQNTLIDNIVAVMKEKNYYALNIDFEYLYPEDRQNYNNFVSRTVNALHPLGYKVSVALAPKLTGDQAGLLYEAHDYPSLGAIADNVIIMTYEWGYLYGPAMAVAPVDQVRKVLNYATSVIPSEKILMGMPNYGYDWTLPFVRGSAARIVTNNGAAALAAKVGATIRYNNTSQSPYFNYYDNMGRKHEVWFDDPRSINARLSLVSEYNLGGVSYWTVNNYHAANWIVLESMYNVKKVI